MNPGPAPRPPTDRPRLALTPNTSNTLPGNMAGLSMQSPAFNNGSQMSLIRTQTERSVSSTATVKEGMVKVKDEGLFKSFVWADRWLVLREFELNFFKSPNASKVSNTIQLRDILGVERSDTQPLSFEITRALNSSKGSSPPRDGPTKIITCRVETDDDVYSWIDSIYQRCPSMGGVSNPTNFTHRVHVGFDPNSGAFVGLPVEWEKLLTASALTKDDYAKNPKAVLEVLEFYTEKLVKRSEDPQQYPSLTPTHQRMLGWRSSLDMVVAAIPWLPRAQRRQAAISAKTVTVKATAVSRALPRSRIVTSRIREGRRSRPDYNVNANVRGKERNMSDNSAQNWMRTMLRYLKRKFPWPNKRLVEVVTIREIRARQAKGTTPVALHHQLRAPQETPGSSNSRRHHARWLRSALHLLHLSNRTVVTALLLPNHPQLNNDRQFKQTIVIRNRATRSPGSLMVRANRNNSHTSQVLHPSH